MNLMNPKLYFKRIFNHLINSIKLYQQMVKYSKSIIIQIIINLYRFKKYLIYDNFNLISYNLTFINFQMILFFIIKLNFTFLKFIIFLKIIILNQYQLKYFLINLYIKHYSFIIKLFQLNFYEQKFLI